MCSFLCVFIHSLIHLLLICHWVPFSVPGLKLELKRQTGEMLFPPWWDLVGSRNAPLFARQMCLQLADALLFVMQI